MKKNNKIGLILVVVSTILSCNNLKTKCANVCNHKKTSTGKKSFENEYVNTNEISNMDGDSLNVNFNSEESLVCLLTGAEQAERKERLQKEIFSQVKKIQEIENGFIFYFKYEETLLIKIMDYIIVENNCCPFFTFETKLHSKDDVALKIIGSSDQVKEMIRTTLVDKE